MFSSKKSDVFVFRKGHSTLKQSSYRSLGGHRHHVRMHIIYKAFFTLATWMPHYWLESLNLEWPMKPTYLSYGYLIFSNNKKTKGRCVIMANLLRCYRHSGLVMYFSTLPAPSASAPCILAILTHLRVRVKICILTHPPVSERQ